MRDHQAFTAFVLDRRMVLMGKTPVFHAGG